MDYVTSFDIQLRIVAGVAITLFLISFLCLIACMVYRARRITEENRRNAVEKIWQPIIYEAILNVAPANLPKLTQRDAAIFAELWLTTLDQIKEKAKITPALLELGNRLNLADYMLKLANSRDMDNQLIGLLTLGTLRDSRAYHIAKSRIDNKYALLSLAAAKTMIEVDPHQAVPCILQRVNKKSWPPGRLIMMLSRAPRDLLNKYMSEQLASGPIENLPTLLSIMNKLAESEFDAAASKALERNPHDSKLMIAVLQLSGSPENLPLALIACSHQNPAVRWAGYNCLSRIGNLQHRDFLLDALMRDDDWNACHQAARTLGSLPGMTSLQASDVLEKLRGHPAKIHWQEIMFEHNWLAANTPIELPAYV